MMRRAAETFAEWRKKVKDEELRSELEAMASDEKTAENRFYKDLQFGTGGLRGELGAGTNAMNIYTVGRASAGLAQYVLSQGGGAVAVCYDTRRKSALFARRTACVLAGRGVRVYLAKECMPTPFLSFAVRHLGAAAGVMITASHNPAQYNGYKVYGSDGCQITDGAAAEISSFISREDYFGKQDDDFDTLSAAGKISYIEEEVETAYLAAVRRLGLCSAEGLRVAYTPLNGTGYRLVPKVLEEIGASICPVPEQSMPDGEFPTCPYPNPEKEEALALGLKYAREDKADILLATDPDADRVGVAVNAQGTFVRLSGNEVGVLLMDYLLGERAAQGKLPENGVVVKTIVTTSLAEKLAAHYGVRLIDVLTGFKYIGETIGRLEKDKSGTFLFGFEESCGYLAGDYVRDKDGVAAAMLIAEMAAHYKRKGKTLAARLAELYAQFGACSGKLLTFVFGGAEGAEKMAALLEELRRDLPKSFAGRTVERFTDYLASEKTGLPRSNVLRFDMRGARVIVRPSGTEPQMKVYLEASENEKANAELLCALEKEMRERFSSRG